MDTQIWYSVYSTLYGGVIGAFDRLGEVSLLEFILLHISLRYVVRMFLMHFLEASLDT